MVLALQHDNMWKNENRSISVTMHKIKSKWIKDLSINPITIKLTEERVGNSLQYMGTGDNFLYLTSVAQKIRATMNKWELLKLRYFCKAKDTVINTKK